MEEKERPKKKKKLSAEENELLAIFGRNIGQAITDKGVNQMDVALGIDSYPNYVSQIVNGRTEPGLIKFLSLCAALDIKPEDALKTMWPAFLKYYKKNHKRS